MKTITAFIGFEGSGKDFATNQLLESLQGSVRVGMSDGIRLEAFEQIGIEPIYGEEYEKWKTEICGCDGFTGRDLLREIGEGRRKEDPFIWSKKWVTSASLLKPKHIIVNDCRFVHEAMAIIRFASKNNYKLKFIYCEYPSSRIRISTDEADELAYIFHIFNSIHYSNVTAEIHKLTNIFLK